VKRLAPATAADAPALAKDADDWRRRIARRCRRALIDVTPEQVAAHANYLTTLNAWNSRMNLTALADRDEAVDRLILEPVAAARHVADAR
jgi:16S rRNA G527 N7-methylase RsmG